MAEPNKIFTIPFAEGGMRNAIPETTAEPGRASLTQGFPPETAILPTQGGITPLRGDFNGIFHDITRYLQWIQAGGQWTYSTELDYAVPAIVSYNGVYYTCIAENGPNTSVGVQAPGDAAYWELLVNAEPDLTEVYEAINANTEAIITNAGNISTNTADISTNRTNIATLETTVAAINSVQVGTVIQFAASTPPSGYLVSDGSLAPKADYSGLYAVISDTHTPEGETPPTGYFYLPNYMDYFLRGHNTSGSRIFGSEQSDAIRNITGLLADAYMKADSTDVGVGALYYGAAAATMPTFGSSAGFRGFGFDASLAGVPTAEENRPINKTVLICIKY